MPNPVYNPFAPPVFPAQQPTGAPNPGLAGRVPGSSYSTALNPLDEFSFRQWVANNNIPFDPNSTKPQDYDMRGFWLASQRGDPRAQTAPDPNDGLIHYNDYWKTPIHETFSNQSQWAPPTAPSWTNDDKLVSPGGQVVFDDRAPRGGLLSQLGLK